MPGTQPDANRQDAVAFAGAIGQPDAHSGELPCAYVELVKGASVDVDDLRAFAREQIHERAAMPKHIEILDELPKTAVGKVFKPDLRKRAIRRVYAAALAEAGLSARMLLQVHDELVLEVPDDEVEATLPVVSRVMEEAPHPALTLKVPLAVEARAAANWEEAH